MSLAVKMRLIVSPMAYYVPEQITPDYKSRLCLWLSRYIKRVKIDGTPDDIKTTANERRQPQIRAAKLPGSTRHRQS